MTIPDTRQVTRRQALAGLGTVAAGLALPDWFPLAAIRQPAQRYFPPPEDRGGWRTGDAATLGVNPDRLRQAVQYHNESLATRSHGGALLIIHRGFVISETYTGVTTGGPPSWTARTCNDMKSSTKSVFGTALGVFLDEYRDRMTLESPLVGDSRDTSLIPQIWEQPLTDRRKMQIRVKHAMSMTSGHESREPWLAPSARSLSPGYRGPFQMYEYCFGWWRPWREARGVLWGQGPIAGVPLTPPTNSSYRHARGCVGHASATRPFEREEGYLIAPDS